MSPVPDSREGRSVSSSPGSEDPVIKYYMEIPTGEEDDRENVEALFQPISPVSKSDSDCLSLSFSESEDPEVRGSPHEESPYEVEDDEENEETRWWNRGPITEEQFNSVYQFCRDKQNLEFVSEGEFKGHSDDDLLIVAKYIDKKSLIIFDKFKRGKKRSIQETMEAAGGVIRFKAKAGQAGYFIYSKIFNKYKAKAAIPKMKREVMKKSPSKKKVGNWKIEKKELKSSSSPSISTSAPASSGRRQVQIPKRYLAKRKQSQKSVKRSSSNQTKDVFQMGFLPPKYPRQVETSPGYRDRSDKPLVISTEKGRNRQLEGNALSGIFEISSLLESGALEQAVIAQRMEEMYENRKKKYEEAIQQKQRDATTVRPQSPENEVTELATQQQRPPPLANLHAKNERPQSQHDPLGHEMTEEDLIEEPDQVVGPFRTMIRTHNLRSPYQSQLPHLECTQCKEIIFPDGVQRTSPFQYTCLKCRSSRKVLPHILDKLFSSPRRQRRAGTSSQRALPQLLPMCVNVMHSIASPKSKAISGQGPAKVPSVQGKAYENPPPANSKRVDAVPAALPTFQFPKKTVPKAKKPAPVKTSFPKMPLLTEKTFLVRKALDPSKFPEYPQPDKSFNQRWENLKLRDEANRRNLEREQLIRPGPAPPLGLFPPEDTAAGYSKKWKQNYAFSLPSIQF